MTEIGPSLRPVRILVASDDDWIARSLESILEPQGYAVLRARSGHDAIELACSSHPDAVVLGPRTSELSGVEVSRFLRGTSRFGEATPIVQITAHGVSRNDRIAAYAAGVWDVCSHPLDVESFLLKLKTFVRAKHMSDRLQEASLLDEATGFYNMSGMTRRARELGADASRRGAPLACAAVGITVVTPEGRESIELYRQLLPHVAATFRLNARASDIIGWLGHGDFLILAPGTDALGASQLLTRLQRALEQLSLPTSFGRSRLRISTAFTAFPAQDATRIDGVDLLTTAAHRIRVASLAVDRVPSSTVQHADA